MTNSPRTPADGSIALIEAKNISRSFGAVRALRDVSVEFHSGEVHGLVGANGAGKSTFLNILSGAITASTGTVLVDGRETVIERPRDADALGFSFIHQELALVPEFSSIDNMTLGIRGLTRGGFASLRRRANTAGAVADQLGLTFDLRKPVRELSVAERGMVAIGRALARKSRFIAMDEPTASLSDVECQVLFRVIRDLARDGVSVAYVSHRLNEIEELSDRVTIFKDGQVVGRLERGGYTRDALVKGITTAQEVLTQHAAAKMAPVGTEVVFAAEGLADGRRVHDVSFECRAGEIVGLAGVVGAGRTEVLSMVFGERPPTAGGMTLEGKSYRPGSVRDAIAKGIALVPEERRSQALIMDDSIASNIAIGNWHSMAVGFLIRFINDRRSNAVASGMLTRLSVKARNTAVPVRTLSGGNQQKVVFARWLARNSRLMLLDEPTRGVDVGARQQIWGTVADFAAEGNGVVVVSSELEELAICHRVFVIVEGRFVKELAGPGVTEEQMLEVIYQYQSKEES